MNDLYGHHLSDSYLGAKKKYFYIKYWQKLEIMINIVKNEISVTILLIYVCINGLLCIIIYYYVWHILKKKCKCRSRHIMLITV